MTAIMLVILDEYGTEVLEWDPETIKMELEEDFRVSLSPDVLDKIFVGIQVLTTDSFYRSLPDFNTFCTILSNDACDSHSWEPADAYDITGAMAEVRLLAPPEGPLEKVLDPEILGYIEIMLRDQHILTPPESLSFIPAERLTVTSLGGLAYDGGESMFQAGYETALENSEELQIYETTVLQGILAELQSLQLEHGDLGFIQKNLKKEESNGDQSNKSLSVSGVSLL